MQTPFPAGMNGGPARAAKGVVTCGAPLDSHLLEAGGRSAGLDAVCEIGTREKKNTYCCCSLKQCLGGRPR